MPSDTVFSPSFGNRPSQLVGREDDLSKLVEGLKSPVGSRDRAVVLLGQRGSGKTVLLWELADRARQQGFVVATPTTATEGMLDRIIEKVQIDGERHVRKGHTSVTGASVGALGFSVGLQFSRETLDTKSFYYKLRSLAIRLSQSGHGILLLVDELQANSADMRQLVGAYQELVGERLDIAMVLAGLPSAVSGTLNDRVLTFLNRATKLQLEPLRIGDIDAFYARAFEDLGLGIVPALRKTAAEATKGSPYLLQLIGHYLVQYSSDGQIDEEHLDMALSSARADFERDVCETTLAALSSKDREFLQAMSDDEGESRISEVAERMGVSVDYAQKYRRRLMDAGVIESSGWGLVRFAVPYLADWLKDTHTLASS